MDEYPRHGRGGQGVITFKTHAKSGDLVTARMVDPEHELIFVSEGGIILRTPVKHISQQGRPTQGVKLMNVGDDDRVAAVAVIDMRKEYDSQPLPTGASETNGDGEARRRKAPGQWRPPGSAQRRQRQEGQVAMARRGQARLRWACRLPPRRSVGSYVGAVRTGDLLFVSGGGPMKPDGSFVTGKVGGEVSVERGARKRRSCARCTAWPPLQEELGDLDKVNRVVKLLGFVNSAPGFTQQHVVMNGASDLLIELFGETRASRPQRRRNGGASHEHRSRSRDDRPGRLSGRRAGGSLWPSAAQPNSQGSTSGSRSTWTAPTAASSATRPEAPTSALPYMEPPVDVYETSTHVVVLMEIAGIPEEET